MAEETVCNSSYVQEDWPQTTTLFEEVLESAATARNASRSVPPRAFMVYEPKTVMNGQNSFHIGFICSVETRFPYTEFPAVRVSAFLATSMRRN